MSITGIPEEGDIHFSLQAVPERIYTILCAPFCPPVPRIWGILFKIVATLEFAIVPFFASNSVILNIIAGLHFMILSVGRLFDCPAIIGLRVGGALID